MRKQVNIFKMNFDKLIRQTIDDLRAYSEGGGMDPRTHDFTLPIAQTGGTYTLEQRRGKSPRLHVRQHQQPAGALPAGALEPAGAEVRHQPGAAASSSTDVSCTRGTRSSRWYRAAQERARETGLRAGVRADWAQLPVLVDGLDDKVYDLYGRVPNGAYVIDADGALIFRSTWADSRKVEYIIDTVLKWYAEGRPKQAVDPYAPVKQ